MKIITIHILYLVTLWKFTADTNSFYSQVIQTVYSKIYIKVNDNLQFEKTNTVLESYCVSKYCGSKILDSYRI